MVGINENQCLDFALFIYSYVIVRKLLRVVPVPSGLSTTLKGAGGTWAAGAAAPVALMVRGQHGGRKCPFQKTFLVYI